jgi:hypothetical protein
MTEKAKKDILPDDSKEDGPMTKIASLLKESQDYENELYAVLKEDADNVASGNPPRLSDQDRDEIVDQINYEAEKRQNYYELVTTTRQAQRTAESLAEKASKQQIETYKFIEKNLDASKAAINAITEDRHKKMKLTEINTYFGKKYQGYGRLARGVVIVAALYLIPYFMRHKFKLDVAAAPLELAIKVFGGIYIVWLVYDIVSRRNDDFDEFVFPMAPTTTTEMINANASSGSIIDISGIDIPQLCAGSYCCGPGTTWSDASGCVFDANRVVIEKSSTP